MQLYKNISGNSPVESYEYDSESITVKFKEKSKSGYDTYRYTYASADSNNIEEMKRLADIGQGLSGYIQQNARKNYDSRW